MVHDELLATPYRLTHAPRAATAVDASPEGDVTAGMGQHAVVTTWNPPGPLDAVALAAAPYLTRGVELTDLLGALVGGASLEAKSLLAIATNSIH